MNIVDVSPLRLQHKAIFLKNMGLLLTPTVLASAVASMNARCLTTHLRLLIYFVLGYFFHASLYAMVSWSHLNRMHNNYRRPDSAFSDSVSDKPRW